MKFFNSLVLCLSIFLLAICSLTACLTPFVFSPFAFSMGEEVVFELKREIKKAKQIKTIKKKKTSLKKFKRKSFSYNKDFVVFNERPGSNLKKGTALRVNIPYPVIAGFDEEFPIYGIVTSPFKAVVSGKIKAIKNTNKALLSFDEIIFNNEQTAIQTFPVFVNGDLKEALIKDIALNFFESLPSVLALALKTQIPQTGIHFINSDLQSKMGELSSIETEKRKRLKYLEFKNIELLKVVIK